MEPHKAMMDQFDGQLATLTSTGAPQKVKDELIAIQKQALEIRELARSTSNFFVWEASDMIAHSDPLNPAPFYIAEGPIVPYYDLDNINEKGFKGDQECEIKKGKFYIKGVPVVLGDFDHALQLNEGIWVYYKKGEWTRIEKPVYTLMHMDTLSKKDDYDTAPNMYLLEGVLEPSERGTNIENRLFSFRDSLITMAAKYSLEGYGGIKDYFIDPTLLVRPPNSHDTTAFEESIHEAIQTCHPNDRDRIKRIIEILTVPEVIGNHGEEYPWIAYQFDHTVIVAAATIFTSLKNDVKMAEQLAIEIVSGRSKVETFRFNKIEPLAFAKTGYISEGDSLGLKVMIAAFDSTEAMNLEYYLDDPTHTGDPLTFSGNPGDVLQLGGGVGSHYVEGTIEVKEKGAIKKKPWKFNYSVGAPNAALANADLVLYKGWDNKIKVSASGYDPEAIKVSCSGCTISKKGDFYIAKAGSGKKATINVSATTEDGQTVKLAAEEFRIFALPKPQPFFANQSHDKATMKKGNAMSATEIIAKLGDSPLNVQFKVTGFKMLVLKKWKKCRVKS